MAGKKVTYESQEGDESLNRAYEEKLVPSKDVVHAWKLVQHVRIIE